MNGQRARFERFAADLLFTIASGKHIDDVRSVRFGKILDELYANPFEKKAKQPQTKAEITEYISKKISDLIEEETRRERHGPDDAGGENRPG